MSLIRIEKPRPDVSVIVDNSEGFTGNRLEFLDGAVEISEAQITTDMIDAGLSMVSRLWSAGLAHRDIKPANVMVQGKRLRLIDVAFAEVRPSPWRPRLRS